MNIRYNIADRKKVDYLKFFLNVSIVLVLAAALAAVGVLNWNAAQRRFLDEKVQLKAYRDKIDLKKQEGENYKKNIKKIKSKWNRKVNFANGLIKRKLYPFLGKLSQLEELLPGGVYINKITLNAEEGNKVRFSISAVSSAKLLETYKVFLKHNLVIQKEAYKDGIFKAAMDITLVNEKPKKAKSETKNEQQ